MQAFMRGGLPLLLLGDIATFFGALVLTLFVRYQEVPSEAIVRAHLSPFLLLFALWVVVYFIGGLYDLSVSLVRKQIPGRVLRIQFINILLAAAFFFMFPFGIEPKTNLVIYLVISTLLIAGWRLYVFPLVSTGKQIKTLVLGDSEEAVGIARVLAHNPYFQGIRAFTLGSAEMESVEEFRNALHRFTEKERVDIIIADMRDTYVSALTKDFYELAFSEQGTLFFDLPSMFEQLHHRVPPSLIGESWFLENVTTKSPHYAYDFIKRVIDVVGALILMIPSAVIFPLVVLAMRWQDAGAIFYNSERVGQYNRPIIMFKFRSMTGMDSGFTLDTNHTVTPVGAVLRKTRLDELPQLWNILRGDLSFIGPRAELPARAEVYSKNIPYYNMRHLIKPGLSGWAQINNYEVPRGEVDVERTVEKLSFDLYYLKNRSLLLDIEIALKTIKTLLMRTGT